MVRPLRSQSPTVFLRALILGVGVGVGLTYPDLVFAAPGPNACLGSQLDEKIDHEAVESKREGASLLARVTEGIDFNTLQGLPAELKRIAHENLAANPSGEMTRNEFNAIYDGLEGVATRYGIQFTRVTDTLGVFPKGLYEIGLSGFGRTEGPNGPVGFAKRHELGHLFHVILIRAAMIEPHARAGRPVPEDRVTEINEMLKSIEGGGNYLEFEKAVTAMASPLHSTLGSQARENSLYLRKLDVLVDSTFVGLQAGKIKFPNGKRVEDVYALALSRAPVVLGTSIGQLVSRLPVMFLAIAYASNLDVTRYGIKPFPEDEREGRKGFRTFIHRLIQTGASRATGAGR